MRTKKIESENITKVRKLIKRLESNINDQNHYMEHENIDRKQPMMKRLVSEKKDIINDILEFVKEDEGENK